MTETNYKTTEIGNIPVNWDVQPLKAIISSANYGVGAEAVPYDGINKYIRITDIDDNSHKFSPSPLCSPSFFSEQYRVGDNDILIARTGASVGKSYIYDNSDGNLIYAGFLIKIRIDEIDSHFVFYNTLTSRYNKWILQESARSGQPGINIQQLKEFLVPIPPKSEQVRIAKALADVDNLISELAKQIDKKRAVKQGAMQMLLTGKKRLRGYVTTPDYKQTSIGEMPMDWNVCSIKDCTDIVTGATPSTSVSDYWKNGTIRWMNSGELNNKFIYDVKGRITKKGYDNTGTHKLPKYCVLIGLAGQGKTRGTAAYNLVELCTNQSIAAILPNNKLFDSLYLYFYMDSQYQKLRELSAGDGGRGGLNKKLLLNFFIPLPPIEEQTAIASVLSAMDKEISTLEIKRDKYIAIKNGMMQQLLTGKIRLL
jgi:type I restriction enzyme S subunit